jgi:glycosyltransferase involved in cell wall biosynthesis
MIESLACGTPVISFEVCSAREILKNHQCGLVVPLFDYSGLIKSIEQLARDLKLKDEYSKRGVLVAQQLFARSVVVPQYENLYLHAEGAA